jgi:hypothetical protein
MPDNLSLYTNYNRRKNTHFLVLLAILLLGAFIRIWISDFTLILLDYDAFYHARIAGDIYQNHHIPTWDAKELGGIPHYYPPGYHMLLVLGKYILPGSDFVLIGSILTVFFGVITTLFVYLIGRRLSGNVGLASALLYTLTPMMALRQGLWARPTGISMMLAILLFYLFLESKKENKYAAPALIVALGYTFTHSSIALVLLLILGVSVFAKDSRTTKTFIKIALASLAAASLYYYRAIPFLNFSVSSKGEYMPVTRLITELFPINDLTTLATAFLLLGLFNLAFFPLIFHGTYEMLKTQKEIAIFSFISFLLVFFKANMFMLLNFTVCIAVAVSIFRIKRTSGTPAAALLLLVVLGMDAALLSMNQGEKKHPNADITREILKGAPLSQENLVLASDPNVGHAIPYYSPAATFVSDLTDIKQYDENRRTFDTIIDETTPPEEAKALIMKNNIDHLLVIGEPLPLVEDSKNFALVKSASKNGKEAHLYSVKK